ncbi:hypothetical protein GIB67_013767 [Kingdonia uniflora]|uniref:DUF4216 domain-containing protein n=1 Tax=Kingdonia uniflora TaxID=39325 RepID=A0A7J7MN55_9MAGN|nr:hypothetical protein GIB67_013767 [Kingdonia uniflora]
MTFQSSPKDKNPLDESMIYYRILTDIIQLKYLKGYRPFLFGYDWARVTRQGIKWDKETNLKLVKFSNLISSKKFGDKPFILAEYATQVLYSKDPKDSDLNVVIEVPQRETLKLTEVSASEKLESFCASQEFNSQAQDKRCPSDSRIPFEFCYDIRLESREAVEARLFGVVWAALFFF